MNLALYLAFVGATSLLVAIPGPTVVLVTSIAIRWGFRAGFTAVLGSTTAAAIYLAVVVAGLASIVAIVGEWFFWIRFIGAVYLIYLGIDAWRSESAGKRPEHRTLSSARSFAKGFAATATNPKMLFFLSAFFPQFIDPAAPLSSQLAILSASFLILLTALDSCWVLLAARIGMGLKSERYSAIGNRIAGTLLIGAGASLALAKRSP